LERFDSPPELRAAIDLACATPALTHLRDDIYAKGLTVALVSLSLLITVPTPSLLGTPRIFLRNMSQPFHAEAAPTRLENHQSQDSDKATSLPPSAPSGDPEAVEQLRGLLDTTWRVTIRGNDGGKTIRTFVGRLLMVDRQVCHSSPLQ
jgi:hypothetical protein